MKSRVFLQEVEKATGVPYASLKVYARELKEAGLLTSGRGGRGAPDMTLLDAARMVIALLATDKPTGSAVVTEYFSAMAHQPDDEVKVPSFMEPGKSYRFDEALALYLEGCVDSNVAVHTFVDRQQQIGYFEFEDHKIFFADLQRRNRKTTPVEWKPMGLRRLVGLIAIDATQLAVPFYIERRDGVTWQGPYDFDPEGWPTNPNHIAYREEDDE